LWRSKRLRCVHRPTVERSLVEGDSLDRCRKFRSFQNFRNLIPTGLPNNVVRWKDRSWKEIVWTAVGSFVVFRTSAISSRPASRTTSYVERSLVEGDSLDRCQKFRSFQNFRNLIPTGLPNNVVWNLKAIDLLGVGHRSGNCVGTLYWTRRNRGGFRMGISAQYTLRSQTKWQS
jgi:hypothetical protein